MENQKRNDRDLVQVLIQGEEEEAFRLCPKEELFSRLEACLEGEVEKNRHARPSLLNRLLKPLPILAPVLFVILLGVIVLLVVIPHSPRRDARTALEHFLLQTPVFQTLESQVQAYGVIQEHEMALKPDTFQIKLEEVCSPIQQEYKKAKREIPRLVLEGAGPSLSLEEKMQILFGERRIHRFFSIYFNKGKE